MSRYNKQKIKYAPVAKLADSLDLDCGIGSDIDIAIDTPNVGQDEFLSVAHPFMREIPSEVDIVHYNNVTADLLKSEIQNKGVELYVYRDKKEVTDKIAVMLKDIADKSKEDS